MKKKINKIFALCLAVIILMGTLPIGVVAEDAEPKEYNINIVYSQNINEANKTAKVVTNIYQEVGLTKATVGTWLTVIDRAPYELIIDGKKLEYSGHFIMPDHDVTIYADSFGYNDNKIPVESLKSKPASYVVATFDAGEHGKFHKDLNGDTKQKSYYVPNYRTVSLDEHIYPIDKGYVVKEEEYHSIWDKPTQDINLTEDTTFTAQYEKKDLTIKFTNRDGKEFTKILPAQSLDIELKDTANNARTNNLKPGERFIGWISRNPSDEYYSNYDLLFRQDPRFSRVLNKNVDYKELITTDHIVKIYNRKDDLSDGYFTLVKDGKKAKRLIFGFSKYTKYYEITKLGGFNEEIPEFTPHQYDSTKEFDFENTPITKDINLIRIDGNYKKDKFYVVSDPKMKYDSQNNETKVDLSGLIVGLNDENGHRKFIPFSEFKENGIETDVKDGQAIDGLNEKCIKVTMGDKFTFSNEPFEIKDDNFEKENITKIEIAQNPKLDYKYDGDKNTELNLNSLKVNLTDKNGVTRNDIPYSDFVSYGLKVKLENVEVENNRTMLETDNSKKLKVEFTDTVFAETDELKVSTSIFDKTKATAIEMVKEPKLNYIVGDNLNLSNLEVKLTDSNGNEKICKYEDADFNTLFDISLDNKEIPTTTLTNDYNGKTLKVTLKDTDKSVQRNITVVDFNESKVTSIEVLTQPKLKYESGDKLDLSELVVTLKDENGAAKEVAFKDFANNHLATSMEDGEKIVKQQGKIKITYTNGDKTLTTETNKLNVTIIDLATDEQKNVAIGEIAELKNLSEEEKKEAKISIEAAKTLDQVNAIVSQFTEKDKENKAAKEAAELEEAKKAAKEEISKLENIDEEAKNAANKDIDNAKSKKEVNKILDEAKKKEAEAKALKELEEAKAEEAAAKEKEKAAEEAKAAADKAKAEADAKAAEAEKAKAEAEAKAKEAEEAAKKAREAAEAETDPDKKAEAEQKAEEAKAAADKAKEESETAKANAEEAKAAAEEAKTKATEAENELEKARLEVKQAEEKVKEKQKAVDEFKEKPETPDDPNPQPEQRPYEPGYNYNPFWFGYFGTNAKTESKTDSKSGSTTPMKLDSKLVIGSKTLKVIVNDVEREVMMDVAPFIANNRTMLPIRFVAEALGFKVDWDHESRTVILTDKDNVVKIPVDTNKIIVNGEVYESDAKPILRNNRTTLPIGNIARALGLKDGKDIIWNETTREVLIKREIYQ